MEPINWYPGHMTKSMRAIEKTIALIDVLVYVLDARAPKSSINPDFDKFAARLPVVYALNKADLADEAETAKWKKKLTSARTAAVAVDSTVSKSGGKVIAAIDRLCAEKRARYAAKGVKKSLRAMVLGVPNTGKSTLINNLVGKARANTGNKAGVTRGKQWFRVSDDIELLDTPGTLYPKLSDQRAARRLAYIGSIKDEVVDAFELAASLMEELCVLRPESIFARYGFTPSGDGKEDILRLAGARGYLVRGGEADEERAANALIDDFRKGRLGRITLDGADDEDERTV